ncbi:MAG: ceramidase domain-containing protein [Methylobacterium sp.]|uniref:ceramidase domain-containing protein n=1 Tax=Methylobacterium sp. TaxID=409 RepID=UPI00258F2F38|nr:ceramidase domain-containing protein [Methylobacterium sp.]MBY0298389.1 ceramidase domain-containing protein [Methylobacterium sp.]
MDWWEPVRAYCERTGAGFWDEPLNALSNGAFLIAAALLLRRERRAAAPDPVARALAGLIGLIGIGSFLFHTLAVRWAELADVLPIALFIHVYFFLALHRLLGLRTAVAFGLTLLFAGAAAAFEPALSALAGRPLGPATNDSVAYAPALLALLGIGAILRAGTPNRRAAGTALIGIAGLFLVSLTARTLDPVLCPVLPTGTHGLWHLLNAGVLYGLVRTASRFRAAGRRQGAPALSA